MFHIIHYRLVMEVTVARSLFPLVVFLSRFKWVCRDKLLKNDQVSRYSEFLGFIKVQ